MKNMKVLIPFLALFLASCSTYNHRYDADQDAYYHDDYYAYDNYDPYYGYGSGQYSTSGDGIYYNNYNYYPDRWGMTYSNVYYSPYRFPRVGFYYSSAYNCGYSYWSTWCSPFNHGHSYYSGWGSAWSFGIGFNNFYDDYYWYNHWRNRTYNHHNPSTRGYYSARNELTRLTNNQHRSRNKNTRENRYNNNNQNNRGTVNRNRTRSNRAVGQPSYRSPSRKNTPVKRTRKQSSISRPNNQSNDYVSSRDQVAGRSTNYSLKQQIREDHKQQLNRSRYQKPALVGAQQHNRPNGFNSNASNRTNQTRQNILTRVKPMNSQSPVYHTNTKPRVQSQSNKPIEFRRRTLNKQSNQVVRTPQSNNRSVTSKQPPSSRPTQQAKKVKSSNQKKDNHDSKQNRSSSNRSDNNKAKRSRDR